MKFSLRSMILIAIVIAGGLLAIGAYTDFQHDHNRAIQLREEIEQMERTLMITHPGRVATLNHALEDYESLRSIRDQAVQHVEVIRTRYSGIEFRDSQTLSLRRLPSELTEAGQSAVEFRLVVPEHGQVWLKFAVHATDDGWHSDDRRKDWLTASSLTKTGPFQSQLPPGEQLLQIREQTSDDNWRVISLNLDKTIVFETGYLVSGKRDSSSSFGSAKQLDFLSDARLPWLYTGSILGDPADAPTFYSVWLSNTPSDFEVEIVDAPKGESQ